MLDASRHDVHRIAVGDIDVERAAVEQNHNPAADVGLHDTRVHLDVRANVAGSSAEIQRAATGLNDRVARAGKRATDGERLPVGDVPDLRCCQRDGVVERDTVIRPAHVNARTAERQSVTGGDCHAAVQIVGENQAANRYVSAQSQRGFIRRGDDVVEQTNFANGGCHAAPVGGGIHRRCVRLDHLWRGAGRGRGLRGKRALAVWSDGIDHIIISGAIDQACVEIIRNVGGNNRRVWSAARGGTLEHIVGCARGISPIHKNLRVAGNCGHWRRRRGRSGHRNGRRIGADAGKIRRSHFVVIGRIVIQAAVGGKGEPFWIVHNGIRSANGSGTANDVIFSGGDRFPRQVDLI